MGEMESRYTQETAMVHKELDEYFNLYSSETIPRKNVNVYGAMPVDDNAKPAAGIETIGDKYIIHLPQVYSNAVNLLHEQAHIIYDYASRNNPEIISDKDLLETAKIFGYSSIEEYFCDSFVDYIRRKMLDPVLTKDLEDNSEAMEINSFDGIFNSILFNNYDSIDESVLREGLMFVEKILNYA